MYVEKYFEIYSLGRKVARCAALVKANISFSLTGSTATEGHFSLSKSVRDFSETKDFDVCLLDFLEVPSSSKMSIRCCVTLNIAFSQCQAIMQATS